MVRSNLADLIKGLEYGTNLHICVVFLNDFGNEKTYLPKEQVIHSKPFCDFMKTTPEGYKRCVSCRNKALCKAIDTGAFGGHCCNGVYEYCQPVVFEDNTVAVICVGNIADEISERMQSYADTFQFDFDKEKCKIIADIIDDHICMLLREYASDKSEFDPLITNILNYIEESLYYGVSVRQLAATFNYNEKYIGKLFKKRTGKTVKEYVCQKRLEKSCQLLKTTALSVTEISQTVGFNNVTYFNRLFKKKYALSPTEYRKQKSR